MLNEAAALVRERLANDISADNYFHHLAVGARRRKSEDEGDESPSSKGDDGGTVSGAGIAALLNTMSMFGGGKLVWAGPLEWLNKEDMESLASYAADPNPQSTLIVSYITDKRSDPFEKSGLVKNAAKSGVVVKLPAPEGERVREWAVSRFGRMGKKISTDAAQRLCDLAGGDVDRLAAEIEKLALYAGESDQVTMDSVEEMVSDHRENEIWDLTGAISRGNLPSAVAALENLLANNRPPQMILKSLTTEVMRLYCARRFKADGRPETEFAPAVGAHPFAVRNTWRDADKWPAQRALSAMRGVMETNMSLMRSGAEPHSALYRLVMELCGGNQPAASRQG